MRDRVSSADSASTAASGASDCCSACHMVVGDMHIACAVCDPAVVICLSCFAKGAEFGDHSRAHAYRVVRGSFSILNHGWTAEEEDSLLAALLEHGPNWDEASATAGGVKTASQCQDHFEKQYLDNVSGLMPAAAVRDPLPRSVAQPVTYAAPMDYPPRPSTSAANMSNGPKDLAGYLATRADFSKELDNTFEMMPAMIERVEVLEHAWRLREENKLVEAGSELDDDDLSAMLQLSAVECYQNRLKERRRVKAVVRELGLLNRKRALGMMEWADNMAKAAGTGYAKLPRFARLMCAFDYDLLVEGITHEMDLRRRLLRLQECRRNGLTSVAAEDFFLKMKTLREKRCAKEKTLTPAGSVADWMAAGQFNAVLVQGANGEAISLSLPTVASARRGPAPLDLVGLSGVERLTQEERSLCSSARVQPEQFFSMRDAMLAEAAKHGGSLRLADARPLCKIDVNKTRRVFDLLVQRGDFKKAH